MVILFLAGHPLTAKAQDADGGVVAGLRLIEEARTTLEESALDRARDYFLKLQQNSAGDAVYFTGLARVDYYRSRAAENRSDKKAAAAAVDRGIEEAEKALGANDRSAEAHSLLGDLYGQKIGLGGFMAGARLGPKIAAENKRALELEENNPKVQAAVGRQYLEAPKMFGGDIERAIASFQKSIQLAPAFDETYVWLALAYRKKGDTDKANQALAEALRLNPRSVFAQSVKSGKDF